MVEILILKRVFATSIDALYVDIEIGNGAEISMFQFFPAVIEQNLERW